MVGIVDGTVPGQAAVFVADQQVAEFSGLTGPTAIGVRFTSASAAEALRDLLGDTATVHTGADKVTADLPGAVPDYIGAISIFGFVLGITGFAAVFVLTGTVSLAVRQRLRELALLRTAGATPAPAAPDVADAVGARWPTLVATDARDPRGGAADVQNQQAAWELMVVISLGFTAIAVVNTFAIATGARRREFADLRPAGATARQPHRMLGRETLITVAVALVLGCVITGAVVGTFSVAQDGTWRLFAEPLRYFGLIGGVGLLGVVAGAVPARLARQYRLPGV